MYVIINVQLNVSTDTKLLKRIGENMRTTSISLPFAPKTFRKDIWAVSWRYSKSFYDISRDQYTLKRHEHGRD